MNGNFGLYRDDGLGAVRATPKQAETIKKQLCKIFRDHSLNITIDANRKVVDYLDVTMNLNDGTYSPYMKENNSIKYVNKNSNHPPSIINNIPASINRRLSDISSTENIFNNAKLPYQQALEKSGYSHNLKFNPIEEQQNSNKRQRKRNIIWYNPPYSRNVTTNISRTFLNIISEEFPKNHPLHKIINRNTVKVSYSCMTNIKGIIQKHNTNIIRKQKSSPPTTENKCNCRKSNKPNCPLEGNCLTRSIIYQATVTPHNNNKEETYIGLTENTFKTRFTNHKASFTHRDKSNTELSNFIWKLKDNGTNYNIKWRVIAKAKTFDIASNRCNLCIAEKFYIIYHPEMATLNEHRGLISACRHTNKQLLWTNNLHVAVYNPP